MLRPVFALLSASIALSGCAPAAIVVDAGEVDARLEVDAARTSSGGSGGLACERIGVVDGLTYCVTTVAGVELKILPPEATEGPLDLAVYLHGDGARAYASDTVLRIQGAWARSRRTLYVAALAPNGCAWWLRPGYTGCDGVVGPDDPDVLGENGVALAAAIEALRGGWDLRNDPILFGGSSGGAVFLSGSFLPHFGDRYHGVFALACGGEAPWAPLTWDAARHGSTVLDFEYGDADMLRPDIEEAIAAYRALGLPTNATRLDGGIAHCAFDHLGWVTTSWSAYRDGT